MGIFDFLRKKQVSDYVKPGRKYAYTECSACGHIFSDINATQCPKCGVGATVIKTWECSVCHYRKDGYPFPNKCPKCGTSYI